MLHSTELYVELFRRKEYDKIPIGRDSNSGEYFYLTEKQIKAIHYFFDQKITFIGYGGSARCFTGETLVKTICGYKQIKDIIVGDRVLSINMSTKKREYKEVLQTFCFSSQTPKEIATFNSLGLKCSSDHEFLFNGKWAEAKELGRRNLEASWGLVSHIEHGKTCNRETSRITKAFCNEASERSEWLLKDYDKKGLEISSKNNKDSFSCCKSIYTESRWKRNSKSQEFNKDRQQSGKLRMDVFYRKLQARRTEWTHRFQIQERSKTRSEMSSYRRKNRYINSYGNTSKRNKTKIQAENIYKSNAWRGIRCFSCDNKRYSFKKELESREIKLNECNVSLSYEVVDIYDLHVKDNENYTVTTENIIVHNSGKTILECFLLTFLSLAYPDTGWFLGRKELKRLRLTVLKTLLKLFSFYGITKDVDYKYNQQDGVINFTNKSDIFLLDLESRPSDPEHLWTGGYEFTGGCVDESNECTESIVMAINARCGWRNNDKYNIPQTTLESFNPDKGHVNRRYWIPFRDNCEKEHEKFIRALPTDNPHPLVTKWVENMRKTSDKKRVERLVDGNFDYDQDPSKLFNYDYIIDMWSNIGVQQGNTRYITVDVARLGDDKTVIFVWEGWRIKYAMRFGKKKLTETRDIIEKLRYEWNVQVHNVIVDEDGVGGGLVDFGYYTGFVNNSKAKNSENYANLKSQCIFEIAKKVNNGEIYIEFTDSEIKAILIEDLEQLKDWNADKDDQKLRVIPKDKIKEVLGRSTDCSDAFMLRMYPELVPPPKTRKIRGLM